MARLCVKLARRYVLYVSETQEQADKHVGAIASLLEKAGVERLVSIYGHSKGWKRTQLRTANGFNVSSFGLDTAARGVKLDQYRPDLIVFDDIDDQSDTARTVSKKIDSITTAIIPAGSSDAAYLFVQNLVHEEGIFAQLVYGRADFLHDRETPYVEPAVIDLQTEKRDRGDGTNVYFVTGGTPTWAGQDLRTVEAQINDWGLRAFSREAQHEVRGASGYFFDVKALKYIESSEVPAGLRYCRAWDLAATQDGGDYTAGVLMGVSGNYPHVTAYVTDVIRGQWSAEKVRETVLKTAASDGAAVQVRLPQDPGQAGKDQAEQFRSLLSSYYVIIQPVTGDKATRAEGFAECMNLGNVHLVKADWNRPVSEVWRKFKPDEKDQQDDDVDAAADAFNAIAGMGGMQAGPAIW